MRSLGIPEERITLTPYSVDNDWWLARSREIDRRAVRASWGVSPETAVILFCAKLQPWKRPQDLLQAFAQSNLEEGVLIVAGEGPLRADMEKEAASLGIADRVRFLGFVNQTQLPALYTASDLLVLPSSYEAFGVVVNEAYMCGCPVVASDHVGAARDLIATVNPTLVYPCGDVSALARILHDTLQDRTRLRQLGEAARRHMETWSPRENIAGTVEAVALGVSRVRPARDRKGDSSLPASQRLS